MSGLSPAQPEPRDDFFTEVALFVKGDERIQRLWGSDLTTSSIFLQTNLPVPVGQRVGLCFVFRGREVKVRHAEVVRVVPFEPVSVDGRQPGVEVAFLQVDPPSRAAIRSILGEVPARPRLSLVSDAPAVEEDTRPSRVSSIRPLSLPPVVAEERAPPQGLSSWSFRRLPRVEAAFFDELPAPAEADEGDVWSGPTPTETRALDDDGWRIGAGVDDTAPSGPPVLDGPDDELSDELAAYDELFEASLEQPVHDSFPALRRDELPPEFDGPEEEGDQWQASDDDDDDIGTSSEADLDAEDPRADFSGNVSVWDEERIIRSMGAPGRRILLAGGVVMVGAALGALIGVATTSPPPKRSAAAPVVASATDRAAVASTAPALVPAAELSDRAAASDRAEPPKPVAEAEQPLTSRHGLPPTPAPPQLADEGSQPDDAAAATPEEPGLLVERARVTVPLSGGRVVQKFSLEDPPRVVIDVEGASFPGFKRYRPGREGIVEIRLGKPEPGKVRVAIELMPRPKPFGISTVKTGDALRIAWR